MALGVVVAFLALGGWNRTDDPRLVITLTHREFMRSSGDNTSGDDPGLQLRILYQERAEPLDARNWLTDSRLADLGFPLDVLPTAPEAERLFQRALPRIGWVAFEYDGDAWRDIDRRRAIQAQAAQADGGPPRPYNQSRLVPVDASPDLETLLTRYPTGHLILRASFRLWYLGPEQKGPLVYGTIRQLIPAAITVPRALRDQVERAAEYEVDLALGRLGIPYVKDIRGVR